MTFTALLAALFLAGTCFAHAGSMVLVARWRRRANELRAEQTFERVSLVRPICGLDDGIRQSLRDSFRLSYPAYELIFCAHSAVDAAVPFVKALIAESPHVSARVLIGDDPISPNPKLNNMVKSWRAVDTDWVVFCDDNVLLPRDYLERLLAARRADSGAVSTIHIGSAPRNLWAHLECAFLNGFQARWYLTTAAVGHGFVNGKTMLFSRHMLDAAGGIEALAAELAEDVALTKIVRGQGKDIAILPQPLEQPLGVRSADDVLGRQVRWARIRRLGYTAAFVPEFLAGGFFPALAAIYLGRCLGLSVPGTLFAEMVFWYGSELVFLQRSGWPWSAMTVPASILRDLTLPAIWLMAWRRGGNYAWRGKRVYGDCQPGAATYADVQRHGIE